MEVVRNSGELGPSKCAWNVKKKKISCRKMFSHGHSTASCRLNCSEEARLTRAPPLTQVMKYMVPSLLALAALKYQGNGGTESPFVENPIPVWCFLASTSAYWLLVGAMELKDEVIMKCCKCYNQNIILSYAALASGLLSPISLFSIFFPPQVSYFILLIWTPLPIWPILKYAHYNYYLLPPNFSNRIITKICTKLGWLSKEDSSLPV